MNGYKNRLLKIFISLSILLILIYAPGCKQTIESNMDEIEENKSEKVEEAKEESKEIEDASNNKEPLAETDIEVDQGALLDEFEKLIKENKKPYELIEFIDKNIEKVSEDIASYMIESLENEQRVYREIYTNTLIFNWEIQENIIVNGEYIEKYGEGQDKDLIVRLTDYYSIGDLNGDGINDVVSITLDSPGDSGSFYYLHILKNDYLYWGYSVDSS